ncbi:MAG TPA: epimerase [Ideonella sp.]|uniref:epimerase n=1 Tax=Ideonella sp. TaxID=1929293 RepID=UPI002C5E9987|nr:epimerase [Ideonella sp.]HSI48676.1 epimerase [Ideonella sp.]
MRLLIIGATGMVGQAVLREALLADDVSQVHTLGRSPAGTATWARTSQAAKLREHLHPDLFALFGVGAPGGEAVLTEPLAAELREVDACCFCLGVSAAGLDEAAYARFNHDLPLAAARALQVLNPAMTFLYVSGAGTDTTEQGRSMWARVKGRTENALQRVGFRSVYLLRPGVIVPLDGIRSKTGFYDGFYRLARPLLGLALRALPGQVLDTRRLGRAMLVLASRGAPKPVLESPDLQALSLLRPATSGGASRG